MPRPMTMVETGSFRRGGKSWQYAAALVVALAVPWAHASEPLRCGSRVVDEGDYAVQVLATCGEPDFRDPWRAPLAPGHVRTVPVEDWYYNFGPSRLLRIVRFRDGRVHRIDSDGYGFADSPRRCGPGEIEPGDSKFRLLARCGEPAQRSAREALVPLFPDEPWRLGPGGAYYRDTPLAPVWREEWVYNFGARHLLRIVTLEDGRVREIRNGERGFD